MQSKTFTTTALRRVGAMLASNWEAEKTNIRVTGKTLFALVGLKKVIIDQMTLIEETLATMAMQHGGEPQEDGSIRIPEEHRHAAFEELQRLGQEQVTIEARPIQIQENDFIPVAILESIFDFVTFID
jgi:hypothetical protein